MVHLGFEVTLHIVCSHRLSTRTHSYVGHAFEHLLFDQILLVLHVILMKVLSGVGTHLPVMYMIMYVI